MRSNDGRGALLIAGVAAVLTYAVVGPLTPWDALHLLHRSAAHPRHHERILPADMPAGSMVRADAAVETVVLTGDADATITVADGRVAVTTESGAPVHEDSSYFDGRKLVLSGRSGEHLTVRVPRLTSLIVNDGIQVNVSGLHGKIAIVLTGPSRVRAAGAVDKLTLVATGPGDSDLSALCARVAEVTLVGGGDADVNATDRLSATLTGPGHVRYRGTPTVSRKILGAGSLEPVTG